jgi:pseudouridine kinase
MIVAAEIHNKPMQRTCPSSSPRGPILCIGAANIDRKLRTLAALAPRTSNPARQHESFGGVARNIAENLARLGLPAALMTAVGDDASGRALLEHAHAAGIDTGSTLLAEGAGTGTYTAVLDHDGEMAVALADMAICGALTSAVLAGRAAQLAAAAMIVADLNLPLESVAALPTLRGPDAALVLVAVSEPKMANLPRDLRGVRLLLLNEGELAAQAGRALPAEADIATACRELQERGAQDVIVTRGRRGVLYTAAAGLVALAAPAATVVEVTGAGDAFAAGVCWSLYQGGADLALACRRGMHLAALTLASPQTVCPDLGPALFDQLPTLSNQD